MLQYKAFVKALHQMAHGRVRPHKCPQITQITKTYLRLSSALPLRLICSTLDNLRNLRMIPTPSFYGTLNRNQW